MPEASTRSAASPPPPPPPAPGRPPLRRRREGRILGGVAAGLADHLDVDVAIVRILFVVVAVLTVPIGLLAYVLGVVFIPAVKPGEETHVASGAAPSGDAPRVGRDPAFWVGVALLVVGALWILSGPLSPTRLAPGLIGRDLLWPLVLIAFGLALWRASDRSTAPPVSAAGPPRSMASPPGTSQVAPAPSAEAFAATTPATYPPPDDTETTVTTDDTVASDRFDGHDDLDEPTAGAAPPGPVDPTAASRQGPPPPTPPAGFHVPRPPAWTPPPEPRRGRSLLTQVTLGLTFLIVGVLWLLRAMNVITLGAGRMAAAALLVIGVGLLVGSVLGRGRWLILAGGLLLPIVVGAELLRPFGFDDFAAFDARGPHGQVFEAPATIDDLEDNYRVGAGTITLDLTDLELDEPAGTAVEVGAGEVFVRLPEDATVDVTARVGAGQITLDGNSTGGLGQQRTRRLEFGEGSDELVLDLEVGLGQIHVSQPPSGVGTDDPAFEPPESLPPPAALATRDAR